MKIKYLLLALGLGLAVLPAQGFTGDSETADVEECACGMDANDNCLQCDEDAAPAGDKVNATTGAKANANTGTNATTGANVNTGTNATTGTKVNANTGTGTGAGATAKTIPAEKPQS